VHNGIEYAEMQLIAEIYTYLRFVQGKTIEHIADLFIKWNERELQSYLLEITGRLLRKKEGENYVIDLILDKAGNKGTGSWTTISACELGVPIPTITEALFARYISFFKEKRTQFAKDYFHGLIDGSLSEQHLAELYQSCRIINHHQGFHLINAASEKFDWNINFSELSRIWTNGCIIRSDLMQGLSKTINENGEVLGIKHVRTYISENWSSVLSVYTSMVQSGIAIPCISASIQYFQGMKQKSPSANIIQAQRDYFGAHTYERVDDLTGKKYHTLWETL
jgi:6-phosphogluconate dehydrogenase